ncbi:MAG: DUF4271 domain-containing protein [Bacteroidota bacterium]
MPKDLTKTIHFFKVYENIYQEPEEDTLQTDTTGTDTTSISQDTTIQAQPAQTQDTIGQQDTLETRDTVEPAQADSAVADSAVSKEDTTGQTAIPPDSQVQQPVQSTREITDTIADLHNIFGVTELPISRKLYTDPAYQNFLYNIPEVKPSDSQESRTIYQPVENSMATTEKTKAEQIKELPIKKDFQGDFDWITFILIGIFLLIGWTRLFFSKYFIALLRSFHSYNYASSLYYGKNSLTIRASTVLNLIFFLTAGTFLFQTMNYYEFSVPYPDPIVQFFSLAAFFLVWYIWNYLTTGFIGSVFLRQTSFQEYFHNYNLYRKILGISLFPVILMLQYISPEYKAVIILIGVIIFGILYVTHILRGIVIFIKKNVSIFYLILYLCALEFLPLLVLYKVFIRGL